MTIGLTVEIQDGEVRDKLDALEQRLGNLEPVLDAIGAKLESNVRIRFDLQQDPTGIVWSPLKPSTLKSYRSKYPEGIPGSLLDRSGGAGMRQSLTYVVEDGSLYLGFGKPYALWHETGTGKMDRRGLLTADPDLGTLGDGDQHDILDILNGYLQQVIE